MDAAKELKDKNPNILFALIGSGSYKETILKRVQDENLNNVKVFPLQPANRLSEVYSFGDIELLPIEKGITKMALPSKSGVIMATGSPVLAIVDAGSDIWNIVSDKKIGFTSKPGNMDDLIAEIINAYSCRSILLDYGQNAKKFAIDNYLRKKQTKKYFDEFLRLQKNEL